MENPIDLTSVLIGVLGGGVGIEVVRQVFALFNKGKPVLTAAQAIDSQIRTHDILQRLMRDTDAHSVVLVESQNGPALQRPGQVMYVTVTCEAVREHGKETQRRFLNVPVDYGYHTLLKDLLTHPTTPLVYKTDEFPSAPLRDIYSEFGVLWVVDMRVPAPENIIRFVSVRLATPCPQVLDHAFKNRVSSAASEIGIVLAR